MLLWAKHKPLPDDVVSDIESTILSNRDGELNGDLYTTYLDPSIPISTDDNFLVDFYGKAIDEMLMDIGTNFGPRLKNIDGARDDFWVQMYNSETTSHDLHDHFKLCPDYHTIISWVHVVKNIPDDLTSFYFKNHNGQMMCPMEQDTGMMFAFPSWAAHGVQKIKVPGHNRIIIAGNIIFPTRPRTVLEEQHRPC